MNNKKEIIEESICKVDIDGTKFWYFNGLRHRENDLPAVEYIDGTKLWYLNGRCHRENDLPAIEKTNGDKLWYISDLLHRKNGPAIEYADGKKSWYWNGEKLRVKTQKEFEKIKNFYNENSFIKSKNNKKKGIKIH